MVSRRELLAALGGAVVSAAVVGGRLPSVDTDVDVTDVNLTHGPWDAEVAAREIHRLTNRERRARDVDPLVWNENVAATAQSYAETMAREDHYGHVGPDGRGPETRVEQGVGCYRGENIARTHWKREVRTPSGGDTRYLGTPSAVAEWLVDGWMHSEGHRENILRPSSRVQGVGVALDRERSHVYAVENFC
jgi:uncharacterized protein YkwD